MRYFARCVRPRPLIFAQSGLSASSMLPNRFKVNAEKTTECLYGTKRAMACVRGAGQQGELILATAAPIANGGQLHLLERRKLQGGSGGRIQLQVNVSD